MKGSTALVKILQLEGVGFISVFPSTGAAAAIINDSHDLGIRTILARQERVAVNIADGYTRVSGKPGVAVVTGGVGVENAFSGLSQAYSDLVPMLLIAGQSPRNRIGSRPIQDLDALFTLHKVTKWAERINYAHRVPELMRRAFTYLKTGRPSPVFLEMPDDVAEEELEDSDFEYKPVQGWRTAGDPRDVEVAVRALLAAKNPLIYVGEGVLHAGAWEELREFVELVEAPVMTTMKAKSVFPEDHPLSVGCGGRAGGKAAAHFLRKADLVFSIGASLTKGAGAPIPEGKLLIQSTLDEWDINREYMADHVILGDARQVLIQLVGEVRRQTGGEGRRTNTSLREEIRKLKREWLEEWMPKLTSNEVPINPLRVVWDLMHGVDRERTIITHDAGCPRDHLAPFWEALTPRGYLGWGHHSTLGYSLGGAMGAKLAQPEKMIINVMGDAAFGMVGIDFETAVRCRIPILTIILNNSGMGMYFEWTPSTSTLSGDYAKVAEGLGGYSERVEKPDEILPAVKRAQKAVESGRPALLDVVTGVELGFQTRYWADLQS